MGIFAYTCAMCGGGYKSCGSVECKNPVCTGGQTCWEDKAYLFIESGAPEAYFTREDRTMTPEEAEVVNKLETLYQEGGETDGECLVLKGTYSGYGYFEVDEFPGVQFYYQDQYFSPSPSESEISVLCRAYCARCHNKEVRSTLYAKVTREDDDRYLSLNFQFDLKLRLNTVIRLGPGNKLRRITDQKWLDQLQFVGNWEQIEEHLSYLMPDYKILFENHKDWLREINRKNQYCCLTGGNAHDEYAKHNIASRTKIIDPDSEDYLQEPAFYTAEMVDITDPVSEKAFIEEYL